MKTKGVLFGIIFITNLKMLIRYNIPSIRVNSNIHSLRKMRQLGDFCKLTKLEEL